MTGMEPAWAYHPWTESRNHAGDVQTSNGGGGGSSREVPSSVRGQGGLLLLKICLVILYYINPIY